MTFTHFLSLIIVGSIGLLTGLILHRKKSEQAVRAKLFDKYLEIRDQLTDILSDLASLSLFPSYEGLDLNEYIQRLSKYFYKYYDLIPERVLIELNCLYLCLKKKGRFAYVIDGSTRIRKLRRDDVQEIQEFVKHVSLVDNIEPLVEYFSCKADDESKRLTINFQARRAVQCINDHFKFSDITSWERKLKKFTILEKD